MDTTAARIGAALLGAFLCALALAGSLGVVILVPLGMFVVSRRARRRGARLTPFQSWMAGVAPFAVVVIVGFTIAAIAGPLRHSLDDYDRILVETQKHPPPQPAFLRQLGVPQPPPMPLPPAARKTMNVVGAIVALEVVCALLGTIAWGGSSLLVYGFRGGRVPSVDPTFLPSP